MQLKSTIDKEVRHCPYCGSIVRWLASAAGTSNTDGVVWKLVCAGCKVEFTLDS